MKKLLSAVALAVMATGAAHAQNFSENFDGKTPLDLTGLGWTFGGVPLVVGGDLNLLANATATFNFTVTTATPFYLVEFFASRPTVSSNVALDVTLSRVGGGFTQTRSFSPLTNTGLGGADPLGTQFSWHFGSPITTGDYQLTFNNGSGALTNFTVDTLTITAVPEPGTYALMLAGLGVVAWAARRRAPRREQSDLQAA